jgi:RNA polymerase sigma-70 factor (ECF subfamily)
MTPHRSVPEVNAQVDCNRAFVTTHWSLIVQAAHAGTSEGQAALAGLCRTYWYPLYAYARRQGHSEADAKDLTQGFFAKLLSDGAIAQADATLGRFRTFLLTLFNHFRAHEHAKAIRQKRGGGCEVLSWDLLHEAETRFQAEPATDDSPERLFDRKWALTLIDAALAVVRREYGAAGKARLFEELKETLWGGRGETSYAEISRRLDSTVGAIKVAVFRLRQRVRDQLRLEVSRTVTRPEDADDELRHLFTALGA